MNDRFKFKVLLKTSEFTILVKPYYILEDSYFIDINQAETEFENKYPEECFWDFIDEIEKQDYIQEISSDSDLIITKDFTNLIQCTGRKDKNGKLIYEGDMVVSTSPRRLSDKPHEVKLYKTTYGHYGYLYIEEEREPLVIGNIYENKELLEDTECQK